MWTGENGAFENADVIASIYDVSEHAQGSLGISQGHFDCLFSFVKGRTEEVECSSVFVWTGIFSKTLLVGTRIFFYTDKKDAFSKISGYVWTRPCSDHEFQPGTICPIFCLSSTAQGRDCS